MERTSRNHERCSIALEVSDNLHYVREPGSECPELGARRSGKGVSQDFDFGGDGAGRRTRECEDEAARGRSQGHGSREGEGGIGAALGGEDAGLENFQGYSMPGPLFHGRRRDWTEEFCRRGLSGEPGTVWSETEGRGEETARGPWPRSLVFDVVSLRANGVTQSCPAIDRSGTLSAGRQAPWSQTSRLVRQPGPLARCGS